jgi:hypothetical protein
VLSPANPSSRLLARQRLVLRRMRYVEPPPVVPDAPFPEVAPFDSAEPGALPGSALPPEPTPPPKPMPFPIPQG